MLCATAMLGLGAFMVIFGGDVHGYDVHAMREAMVHSVREYWGASLVGVAIPFAWLPSPTKAGRHVYVHYPVHVPCMVMLMQIVRWTNARYIQLGMMILILQLLSLSRFSGWMILAMGLCVVLLDAITVWLRRQLMTHALRSVGLIASLILGGVVDLRVGSPVGRMLHGAFLSASQGLSLAFISLCVMTMLGAFLVHRALYHSMRYGV